MAAADLEATTRSTSDRLTMMRIKAAIIRDTQRVGLTVHLWPVGDHPVEGGPLPMTTLISIRTWISERLSCHHFSQKHKT
jgi:hypothetical protein